MPKSVNKGIQQTVKWGSCNNSNSQIFGHVEFTITGTHLIENMKYITFAFNNSYI